MGTWSWSLDAPQGLSESRITTLNVAISSHVGHGLR